MAPDDNRAANPRDEEIPSLFGAYALGALPAEDMAAVEAYLAAHPEAEAEVAMLTDAAAMLPYSVDAATPDPRVRMRLMAQVYQEALAETEGGQQSAPAPTPIRQRPRGLIWPIAAAILLLFTVGFGGWAVSLRHDLSQRDATVAAQQTTVASTFSTSPVQGTAPGPMRGEVTKLGDSQTAVLTVSDMPPLASDKVYQVWFINGNTPTGAGLFSPNPDGSWSGLVHGDVNGAQKIAISIEPLGGSLTPTGAIVAQGSL
jgi:anti-sigma-K factor RskA